MSYCDLLLRVEWWEIDFLPCRGVIHNTSNDSTYVFLYWCILMYCFYFLSSLPSPLRVPERSSRELLSLSFLSVYSYLYFGLYMYISRAWREGETGRGDRSSSSTDHDMTSCNVLPIVICEKLIRNEEPKPELMKSVIFSLQLYNTNTETNKQGDVTF